MKSIIAILLFFLWATPAGAEHLKSGEERGSWWICSDLSTMDDLATIAINENADVLWAAIQSQSRGNRANCIEFSGLVAFILDAHQFDLTTVEGYGIEVWTITGTRGIMSGYAYFAKPPATGT